MSVVHISEQDAIRDFAAVLARLDAGDEVTIERNGTSAPVRILRALPLPPHGKEHRAEPYPAEGELQYLSEFRQRHPESLDSSRWD